MFCLGSLAKLSLRFSSALCNRKVRRVFLNANEVASRVHGGAKPALKAGITHFVLLEVPEKAWFRPVMPGAFRLQTV
jgi:hypothetical protein